jgi:hypothetical protein
MFICSTGGDLYAICVRTRLNNVYHREAYTQSPGSAIRAAVSMDIAMKISRALSSHQERHQEIVRHSLGMSLVDISKLLTGGGKYGHQT